MLKDEQNGLHSKSEIYWYCSYKETDNKGVNVLVSLMLLKV